MVPATLAGQKFCIVYALLGVPLCLGFVCSVGQWFTKLSDHIRDHSIRQKSLKFLATPGLVLFFFITHLVLPAISFSIYEDWSFHESVYFCFITLSTVGFGDYVAGEKPNHRPLYKIILIVWTFYGMALLTSIVTHVGRAVVSATKLNSTDEKKESTDAACQTEAELW